MIIETQEFLPSKFECIACGLKMLGLSQLHACGLASPYRSKATYTLIEYYANQYADLEFDDDNNE
jgi:hypothetical protein